MTTLVPTIKRDLGIKNNLHDASVETAIEAAKIRMQMAGVVNLTEYDPTVLTCIELYCRHYFNFQGEAARFFEAFEFLTNAMALSTEYGQTGEET